MKFRPVLFVVMVFATMFVGGMWVVLYHDTMVQWWVPVGVGAFLGVLSWPLTRRVWPRVTGTCRGIINFPCNLLLVGVVTSALFLGINYWGASPSSAETIETTVSGKYRKQHTRYRRLNRRTRVADGYWYSYRIVIGLPDGREKEIEVPLSEYNHIKTGSRHELTVQQGAFGFNVIKDFK